MTLSEHFVRGFTRELTKSARVPDPNREERTYTIEGKSYQLDEMERMLSTLEYLGMAGASRLVQMSFDGDGAAFIRVNRKGGKIAKPDNLGELTEGDKIKFGID